MGEKSREEGYNMRDGERKRDGVKLRRGRGMTRMKVGEENS